MRPPAPADTALALRQARAYDQTKVARSHRPWVWSPRPPRPRDCLRPREASASPPRTRRWPGLSGVSDVDRVWFVASAAVRSALPLPTRNRAVRTRRFLASPEVDEVGKTRGRDRFGSSVAARLAIALATNRNLATPRCLQPASKQRLGGATSESFPLVAPSGLATRLLVRALTASKQQPGPPAVASARITPGGS
jgi:hypothetical protein